VFHGGSLGLLCELPITVFTDREQESACLAAHVGALARLLLRHPVDPRATDNRIASIHVVNNLCFSKSSRPFFYRSTLIDLRQLDPDLLCFTVVIERMIKRQKI